MPDAARIAQAIALEIPVTVQGSRPVKDSEQRELFTETTTTILTFDNGAMLNLKSRVLEGQSLFLRNDQSGREILCKVLEAPPEGEIGCTELEFTVVDPEFWGVQADERAVEAHKPEEQKPQETPEAIQPQESAQVVRAAQPKVEPGLLGSGEIDAPAEETPAPTPPPAPPPETAEMLPEHSDGPDLQDAKTAEQLATMLAKESRGSSARRASAAREAKPIKQETAPDASAKQMEAGSTSASDGKAFSEFAFRIRGLLGFADTKKIIGIGIAAALLIVLLVGVTWHARRGSAIHGSSRTSAGLTQSNRPAMPAPAQPPQTPTSTPATIVTNQLKTTAGTGTSLSGHVTEHAAASLAPKAETSRDALDSRQASSARAEHRHSNHLNARDTVPAQIVSEPQPTFPQWAKDLELDGTVKLDALIDAKGNVSEIKPLSGPRALQHAAETAVELWIFQPALSEGVPTSSHVVLTVEFQR